MDHFDAVHHFEQLARQRRPGPVAGRRHVDFAWIGLGIHNQLYNGLRRERRVRHHYANPAVDTCDRHDVADEIKIELLYSAALLALTDVIRKSVYPSGGARTTASAARLLAAPGRFSTMNCWPSRSESQ